MILKKKFSSGYSPKQQFRGYFSRECFVAADV